MALDVLQVVGRMHTAAVVVPVELPAQLAVRGLQMAAQEVKVRPAWVQERAEQALTANPAQ